MATERGYEAVSEPLPLVKRLLAVLGGRKGFNWWWEPIDEDVKAEIITELNAAVAEPTARDLVVELDGEEGR